MRAHIKIVCVFCVYVHVRVCLIVLRVWECQLKKYSQPKLELCFIWWEFLGFQARETASQATLRDVLWGGGGEERSQVRQRFCHKGQVVWPSKGYLLIKENQITQIEKFNAFLSVGRGKSLGSLKWFLWYAPQLSGSSIPFSHSEFPFFRAHLTEWLESNGC